MRDAMKRSLTANLLVGLVYLLVLLAFRAADRSAKGRGW